MLLRITKQYDHLSIYPLSFLHMEILKARESINQVKTGTVFEISILSKSKSNPQKDKKALKKKKH